MVLRARVLLFSFFWLGLGATLQAQVLRFAAIPEEPQAMIQQRFTPLIRYLESRGMSAVWIATPDLNSFVDALTAKRIDFAWTNAFTFVQARARMGGNLACIAHRREDTQFQSVFVVRDESLTTLDQLTGKSITFGPRASTTSHLMPRAFLKQIAPGTVEKLSSIRHAASQEAVVDQVARGVSDGGALSRAAFEKMKTEQKLELGNMRVLYTSPHFHEYCFVVTGDRDPALFTALQAALIGLDPRQPSHKAILHAMRATRLVAGSDDNYVMLDEIVREIGLIGPAK